jgi:hypothetical protein
MQAVGTSILLWSGFSGYCIQSVLFVTETNNSRRKKTPISAQTIRKLKLMQTKSKVSILIAIIAVVAFGIWHFLFPPLPSDKDQISSQIQAMVSSAENRNSNGVMQGISGNYSDDNGLTTQSLKMAIVKAMREASNIKVEYSNPDLDIKGDSAQTRMMVKITFSGSAAGDSSSIKTPLVLQWKKESGERFLIIPTKVWRVTHASYQYMFPDE